MHPCSECKRHIRTTEQRCPFCGTQQRFVDQPAPLGVGAFALAALMFVGATACSPREASNDGVTTTTSSTSSTTGDTSTTGDSSMTVGDSSDSETTTTSSSTDTNDSSESQSSATGSFYAGSDGGPDHPADCDSWLQDCPEGEKCVPYTKFVGSWTGSKCVPVLGDNSAGEACTFSDTSTAIDDCDETTICWNYSLGDNELVGTCTQICSGSAEQPECPEATTCYMENDLAVCLTDCDPLSQACADGLGCYWLPGIETFSCVFTTTNVPEGQPCASFANSCEPGTLCVAAEQLPSCEAATCCTLYCSLSDPMCGPETECLPFFADLAGPEYADVGVCLIPE